MKTITLTSFIAVAALVACSSQTPQLQKDTNRAFNYGYDQNPFANTQNQNRAPILHPISAISVNAGSSFNVTLQGTDPENAIVRYIVTCPPELGGTQNSPRGSFTISTSRDLGSQDVQCGGMVVDNFGLQGKQVFQVKVKSAGSTKKTSAFDVKGSLMSIAFPIAMKGLNGLLNPQKKPTDRTASSSTSTTTGDTASNGGLSGVNWDQLIASSNANNDASGSNFATLANMDIGSAYTSLKIPTDDSAFDWNNYLGGFDASKAFDTSGTGAFGALSGISFKDIWNGGGLSYDTSGIKVFEQSAGAFGSDLPAGFNPFDPNLKFEYKP